MLAFFESLGEFIVAHHAWAGPIVLLLIFAESMAVIGAFIPASAVMIVIGGLIGADLLEPLPMLAWGIAGAILGDAVSYWIGRAFGPRLWRRPFFRKSRRLIAQGRLFFRQYGVMSIALGRFMGPARSMIPLLAGTFEMRQGRFQFSNIASAFVWVPVMYAPGYLASRGAISGAVLFEEQLTWFLVAAVVVIGGATVWLGRKRREARRQNTARRMRPRRAA